MESSGCANTLCSVVRGGIRPGTLSQSKEKQDREEDKRRDELLLLGRGTTEEVPRSVTPNEENSVTKSAIW